MSYRIRDILIAGCLLLLLVPVYLLIILLLGLSQKRIFFFQTRPGLHGKPFKMYKFSTLYDAAPGQDEALNQLDRLTPIGKYLRKLSLDELPQLLNVLKGEMALIGPRPLLMEYLPLYSPEQMRRHEVLPGITGWAQVNGRNLLSFTQKFSYDLWYVENRSHWLDLKIMWLTLTVVFRRKGVNVDTRNTARKFDGSN